MATFRSRARDAARAGARARAQASASKRVASRKASGRKPSGANRSGARARARERAQAAAEKRIAQGRTISQTKAANKKKMRAAAAERHKKFQAKRAAKKVTASKGTNTKKKVTNRRSTNRVVNRRSADRVVNTESITNYNMKYNPTPEFRAKAYEQSLNKKSFKGLSDGQTFGVGPVASGDAYARGLNTDNQNVENRLRQVRNLGSTLTGGLISPVRKLTDKEIADRRMKVQAKRQAKFMGRKTGGKNKNKRNKEVNILPFGSAGLFATALAGMGWPTSGGQGGVGPKPSKFGQEGTNNNNLAQIQNEAYNTALSNSMAGLAGDFDSGTQGSEQGSEMSISQVPGLQAGQSRGLRRIRRFNSGRRRGASDSLRRGGRRIQEFTSTQLNI